VAESIAAMAPEMIWEKAMKQNPSISLAITIVLCLTVVCAIAIMSVQPAKAIPDSVGQYELWSYQGHVTTAMTDIVTTPGANRCLVLDIMTVAIADAESSTAFKVLSDTTDQEMEYIPTGTAVSPWQNVHQRLRLPEDEGISISTVGSGAEIFLTLEGHYEHVF
jgi:hypothetical protein